MSEVRIATAFLRDDAWWIAIEGTEISRRVCAADEIEYGRWPGHGMGHRLIEEGFMPDRSGGLAESYQKAHIVAWAGWVPFDGGWKIPCVRIEKG